MNLPFLNRGGSSDHGYCFAWIIAIIILLFFFTDLDDCFKTST